MVDLVEISSGAFGEINLVRVGEALFASGNVIMPLGALWVLRPIVARRAEALSQFGGPGWNVGQATHYCVTGDAKRSPRFEGGEPLSLTSSTPLASPAPSPEPPPASPIRR